MRSLPPAQCTTTGPGGASTNERAPRRRPGRRCGPGCRGRCRPARAPWTGRARAPGPRRPTAPTGRPPGRRTGAAGRPSRGRRAGRRSGSRRTPRGLPARSRRAGSASPPAPGPGRGSGHRRSWAGRRGRARCGSRSRSAPSCGPSKHRPQVGERGCGPEGGGWETGPVSDEEQEESGQLALMPELVRARARAAKEQAAGQAKAPLPVDPAPELPVARVLVDVPLAHLDRPFDYLVPAKMHAERRGRHPGQGPLRRAGRRRLRDRAGGEQRPRGPADAAAPGGQRRSRCCPRRWPGSPSCVAARYAGTRSDVLRLAVPSRHATTEKQDSVPAPAASPDTGAAEAAWSGYDGGAAFARRLADGGSPRAVWSSMPGHSWPTLLAHAAAATYASGRGSLICVPDHKDVARLDAALTEVLGAGRHVVLTADSGPAQRYRSFLAVSRGAVRIVVGTRAAAFAPVHDLGLVALWDDGDDLYAEPRAPYPHTREVLLTRAHEESAGGPAGWVRPHRRGGVPRPHRLGRDAAARAGGAAGRRPAGVDHRRDRQGARARPARPHRPAAPHRLRRDPRRAHPGPGAAADPAAGLRHRPWPATPAAPRPAARSAPARCGRPPRTSRRRAAGAGSQDRAWACAVCGGRGLRAPVLGDQRTAEEIGRAFPSVPVRTSAGDRVLATVEDRPSLVVATPGAEPVAEAGYACVVLLDTWLMLGRTDLRTVEEALRRWFAAAALARPAGRGRPGGGGGRAVRARAAGPGALGPDRLRGARARGPAVRAPAAGVPAGHADRSGGRPDLGGRGAGAPAGRGGARPGAGRGDRPGRRTPRRPRSCGS